MLKKASIDLGSNSLILLIAQCDSLGNKTILEDKTKVVGLGRKVLQTKKFSIEAMNLVSSTLMSWLPILKSHEIEPQDVHFVTTESARIATNSSEFFTQLFQSFGFKVEIISDTLEAHYAALGLLWNPDQNDCTICDLGGASTEIIYLKKNPFNINFMKSLKIGSVTYDDLSEENWNTVKKTLRELPKVEKMIGIAGTFTTLACLLSKSTFFDLNKIEGFILNRIDLEQLDFNPADFEYLKDRLPTIDKGRKIILLIMNELNLESIKVSTFGLRHGVVIEDFKKVLSSQL